MKTKSKFYPALYLTLTGFAPLCQSVDVVLTPNTISGQVRFNNSVPAAVSILDGERLSGCLVQGVSSSPTGFSASTSCPGGNVSPITGKNYSLTVESSGGVTYGLFGRASLYTGSESGFYYFDNKSAISVTPAMGATVDFQECAGIIDFKIGSNACATPASVDRLTLQTLSPARFANKNVFHPVSQTYFIVPDMGQSYPILYTFQQGTDPFSNQIQVRGQTTTTPQCDVVTPVCIESPLGSGGGGGGVLGQIVGAWDIVGEFEVKDSDVLTRIYAYDGPDGNFRLDSIPGTNFTTPSSSPPNVPWQLENLPAGNYNKVGGMSLLRSGRASNWFAPESLGVNGLAPVAVSDNTITNLGNTFVMTPGFFFGDILLKDPFTVASGGGDNGAYSGLRYLVFNADQDGNGDGVPDNPLIGSSGSGSFVGAVADNGARFLRTLADDPCNQSGIGCSQTAWPHVTGGSNGMNAFDPGLGAFSSNYELVIANANNPMRPWQTQRLQLVIQTLADTSSPTSLPRRSLLTITDNLAPTVSIGPGNHQKQDFKYCFGDVRFDPVNFRTSDGSNFYDPQVSVFGQFSGANFLKQTADYRVDAVFYGTPVGFGNRAPNGQVRLTLPEGTGYVITPTVQAVASSGSVSTTTFVKTTVDLRCGQRVDVAPGLSVSLNALPDCAPGNGLVNISGSVKSNGDAVSRIYYTVNGGPQIDICASTCSADPTFSASVNVVNGNNTITVFATSSAGTASTSSQVAFGTGQCAAKVCDINRDGVIDQLDLSAISRARGKTPLPGDPRDANGDGTISPADVKFCIPKCTRPNCATQ